MINDAPQNYDVTDEEIRIQFQSLKLQPLQEIQSQISIIEQEKHQIQSDNSLQLNQKQKLIQQCNQQIAKCMQMITVLKTQLFKMFSSKVREQVREKLRKQKAQKEQQFTVEITKHYDNQKWQEPIKELQYAKNQDWMKNPLPTVLISLVKKSSEPVKTKLSQKVQITINKILDSQGKPFEGILNFKSSTCDSLNEPQKLKSLPPLVVLNQNDRNAPPRSKLISFSMQTNQFEDENGKLIFPAQPLRVVEKIDHKKIKPQVLKEYKVWNWDVLSQRWIETGPVEVSPDGKQVKYEMKPKSRQEMLRVFHSIGQTRKSALPKLVFNVENIRSLIPTLKEISSSYEMQVKKAQIEHQYRLKEVNSRAGIQATEKQIKQLNAQGQVLRKINQQIKKSGKSMFYDLVSDFLLKKETLKPDSPQLKQQLIYVPSHLREVESHFIYRSMNKLNKKSFPFKLNSEKYTIKAGQYEKYLEGEMLKKMTDFVVQGDLKKQDNILNEIDVESPNRKFVEKYILVHPKMPFFINETNLEKINRAVDVQALINLINKDTLKSLNQKIKTWSLRKAFNSNENQIKSVLEQGSQQASSDLAAVYEEDKKTVAQLIIESRLNKIKLISKNKFMLRLQLAILFALPTQKLEQFQSELIYTQTNNQKQTQLNQRYLSSLPQYQGPSQRFLQAYCQFFKTYADEHQETLRAIFTNHLKDSLQIEQKTLMKPVDDPSTQRFIKEIEDVFDESVKKGLFEQKQMQSLKKPKIEKIKREYVVVQEWNQNQQLIQRIYSQFFPTCSYNVSTYNELIDSMNKYCETRQVLMSEKYIEKFSGKFNSKYVQYMSKSEKRLPGGAMDGYTLRNQLKQKYGAQAAWAAFGNICNLDMLMNLSPEQVMQYEAKAVALAKVNRNNIPQFVDRKRSEVSNYLSNPSNFKANVNESLLKSNTDKSLESLNQATETIEKQKRQNDSTIKSNLGTNSSLPKAFKDNKSINNQFQIKLKQTKPTLQIKQDKNLPIQKSLNSVNQLNNQLDNQLKGIDALAQNLSESIIGDDESIESEKISDQVLEKTMEIIDQRKQTLQRGTKEAEKQILQEKKRNQIQMEKANQKDPHLENTKTRVKIRNRKIQQLKTIEQLLSQAEENLKLVASNSVKNLLREKN